MKRIGMIGVCLAAVFAVSAVFAGGALAAKHVNEGPLKYTSTSKLAYLEQTGGVSRVECKVSESSGEWFNSKEGKVVVTFHVCEALGQKCNSAGETAGVIKTETLRTTLGWLEKGKKAGVRFTPFGATDLADYECPGATPIKERSKGATIGEPSPANKPSLTSGLKVEGTTACRKVGPGGKYSAEGCASKTGGEWELGRFQEWERFEGGPKETIESEVSENGGATYSPAAGIQNVAGSETINTAQKYKKGSKELEAPDPGYLNIRGATPAMDRCIKGKKAKWADAECTVPAAEKNGKFKGKYELVPVT